MYSAILCPWHAPDQHELHFLRVKLMRVKREKHMRDECFALEGEIAALVDGGNYVDEDRAAERAEERMVAAIGTHAVDEHVMLVSSSQRAVVTNRRDSARRARALERKSAKPGPRRRKDDPALDARRENARVIGDDR